MNIVKTKTKDQKMTDLNCDCTAMENEVVCDWTASSLSNQSSQKYQNSLN